MVFNKVMHKGNKDIKSTIICIIIIKFQLDFKQHLKCTFSFYTNCFCFCKFSIFNRNLCALDINSFFIYIYKYI